MKFLDASYPNIPIISEENKEVSYKDRSDWDEFWLVDPLDGTKEFIKRNGEFTVNIALIRKGDPVFGVVYQPAEDILYFAERGSGSFKKSAASEPVKISNDVHYMDLNEVKVVASRSHLTEEVNEFVQGLERIGKKVNMVSVGSSLKLCLVAEGAANVYPRFGPTMEWDTGAAQAVVMESGRRVINRETNDILKYNKFSLRNPRFIVE
jgi:3'(2'), 5'-bisphosphate nucleotidase